jgi:hypothetical protein|tara:strand:+ start:55940 stop:56119 length:180 start_codon:yes stop_codon:yes gene_type:complete
MAEIATAKKTLDALKKAHKSGDATKTASLLGTLKVRTRERDGRVAFAFRVPRSGWFFER